MSVDVQQLKDKLASADEKAAAAEQELAISRRQLERLQDVQRTGFSVPAKPDEENHSQLRVQVRMCHTPHCFISTVFYQMPSCHVCVCMQIQELMAEKDEMRQRAATLQNDKERLLGMVSRLELEKHTLESSMRHEEAY